MNERWKNDVFLSWIGNESDVRSPRRIAEKSYKKGD